MKRNLTKGLIAMLLSTVMFSQAVPMDIWQAVAEGVENILEFGGDVSSDPNVGMTDTRVDTNNIGNGYIVQENTEKRTLTTKEYLMSDNTIMVQQFSSPIHYYENGEYKEIDNTLVETTNETGESVYKNTANSFTVEFDNTSKKNTDFVSIEEDGYDLQIGYKAKKSKKVKLKVKNPDKKDKTDYKKKKVKKPSKNNATTSSIAYENVETDTSLTYKIKNKGLISDIKISSRQDSYTYTFELQSSNLTLKQMEDGSIVATNKNGEEKFILLAPYITDANGVYSNKVTYTLNETDGKTQLILTADSVWLNEQASFPVRITPELKSVGKKNVKGARI